MKTTMDENMFTSLAMCLKQYNLKMEVIPEGRHFRLVQESELPEILNYLEQYLPEALKFHQTIKTYLNDRIWQFYFYVTKNWPEDPVCLHFPGCTLTPNKNIYESFGIFCPTSRIECVDLMETEDILIDWTKPLYLNFTHKAIMNRLDSFYSAKGGVMERLEGDIYVNRKSASELEGEELSSDEVEMRQLSVENVKAIHDLYPASEIECVEVFEKLVQVLPGVGIFKKKTDELAAWMVHSYYGAMFSMQTKPEFRRKGYGIHLARSLTKLVIERGYLPFVVIRPENDASRSLYTKLGFEKVYETVRATLRPPSSSATVSENEQNQKEVQQENKITQNNENNGRINNHADGGDDDGDIGDMIKSKCTINNDIRNNDENNDKNNENTNNDDENNKENINNKINDKGIDEKNTAEETKDE